VVNVARDLEEASEAMTVDSTPMIFPVKLSTILKSCCGGPMSRTRILLCATLMLALVCLYSSTALAQYGASLQGTVMDKSGAVVAGATVTATNQASGISRSATTGDSGFYRITGLAPGRYSVTVEAQGFKKSSTDDVAVAGEAQRGLDLTLVPTQVQEIVTVSAAPDPLSTEDATLSSTLSSREIDALPKFGRDPYELVRFAPGVFGDSARQGNGNSQVLPQQVGPGGSNFSLFQTENAVQVVSNGQRITANNYTLDGVSTNSLSHGGATVVTPNPESVEELQVISGFSSAQDGRNSGAQIKVLSKSGVNNFHGSAFVKFDDKGLNSFNKFYGPTNVPLSEISCEVGTPDEFKIVASHCPSRVDQRYRDYAGSFGGPIIKNHLFFFFSYEGLRQNSTSISRDIKLEAPSFRDYVISANPNSIAAQIFNTPGIAPRITTTTSETDCCSLVPGVVLGQWYVPGTTPNATPSQAVGGGPDGINDWGIYDLTLPSSTRGDQYNGRVDFKQGNNQFFASTYIVRLDQFGGGQRPLEDVTLKPSDFVGTIGWTRTFGSTMLNELRFNGTRFTFDQTAPVGQTNFGIPQIRLFDFDAGGLGDPGRIIGVARSSTTPAKVAQNTYAFADTFSLVRNRHGFKFGVQITREENNNDQPGGERPDYQFRGLLNFANDACCFFESVTVDPRGGALNSKRYFRTGDYGIFAQDDWKVKPNLTLNLGLRWEYFQPDHEAGNVLSNYLAGSEGFINGSVQTGSRLYESDYNNFGPRIGFAWSPVKYDNKIVFRGGYGLLYNRYFGDVFDNVRQNTPYTAEVSTCCFFDPGPIVGPPPGSNILYAIGANRQANSYPVNPALAFGVAPDGALCGDPACDTITKVDLFAALPNTRTPYVHSFNFQTQYQPIRHLVATLGYQGSRSRKMVRTIDVNRLIPGDTFDGTQDKFQNKSADGQLCGSDNPACLAPHATGNNRFNRIFVPLPDVNINYDAAIFQLRHQFHGGLELASAYTWSHTIDTASYELGYQQADPFTPAINRSSADYDVRQNWVVSGLWEVPFLRHRKDFVGTALGGWTISGVLSKHSGFPFSALIGSCDTNNDRNGDGYCPDLPFAYNGGAISSPSKQEWINGIFPNPTAEFDTSTRGPGCRCRNIFSGPGYTSVDMTVGKDFSFPSNSFLGEAARLEIRANFFNAFNILNLQPLVPATAPTDILNTSGFGRPPDGQAGRVIELQARFVF
jgi:hypothetical protein